MDRKSLDAKFKAAGISDDTLRAVLVENTNLDQDEATLDRVLATEFGRNELLSLAKCYSVPGFTKVVDEIGVIGTALAAR